MIALSPFLRWWVVAISGILGLVFLCMAVAGLLMPAAFISRWDAAALISLFAVKSLFLLLITYRVGFVHAQVPTHLLPREWATVAVGYFVSASLFLAAALMAEGRSMGVLGTVWCTLAGLAFLFVARYAAREHAVA